MNDNDLLKEVRERYDLGWSADVRNREAMESDLRFVAGDQWPEDVRLEREGATNPRPCITENLLPQFVRRVANDMRANPPAIKVIAGAGGASKAVADILTGMIRNIEAQAATLRPYVTAGSSAARCGIGHWRVLTDYTSPTSFEQEIKIEPIHNPFAVVWDPVAIAATREDANWCFVIEEMSEDEFKLAYPKASPVSFDGKDNEAWFSAWLNGSRKTIRVAEYWRKVRKPAKVCLLVDGSSGYKDDLPKERHGMIMQERDSERVTIEVTKTNGFEVLEKTQEWPGQYIPIVPVVGEEYSVGEQRVRHSVIRFAKDTQQLYNYWLSTQTEHLALQPKAPYVATAKQVAKYADIWKTANTENHSVLIYDIDTDNPNSRPQREMPPAGSAALSEQIARAAESLKATTGIYEAALGQQGNEKSGIAIRQRQQESDIGTFEFRDNLNASVEYTGYILIDLIPIIYDTPRMVRILGEDGEEDFAEVNKPQTDEMGNPVLDPRTGQPVVENDLKAGEYGVFVRSGPSYMTRRQEAAESMMQFIQTAPQAAQLVLDLVAKNMDWPGADEFAERFKKMLPPNLQPETDDPEEQAERQQAAQEAAQVAEMQQRGAQAEIAEKEGKAAKSQADAQKSAAEAAATQMQMMLQSGQVEQLIQQAVQAQVQAILGQMMQPQPPMVGQPF